MTVLTATGAAGLATVVATGGNPVATGMAMYTTFSGFNSMNQSTMQGKSDGEALLDGLYGALKGGITFGVAVGAGTLAFNTLCAAGMPMWAVITGEGIAGGVAGGTTNRLLNGMEVNAETIFIDGFWGGATAATMYGAAKLVNYVISSRMPAGTSVADDAALANQMSQVDDCDNALGTNGANGTKSIDDMISDLPETTNGRGVARNFESSGGFEQTLKDFDSLNPSNIKDIQTQYGMGRVGTLSNGTTVVARPGSTTGGATLEIRISNSKVYKIRY